MMKAHLSSTHIIRLGIGLLLSIVVRLVLYGQFPVFLTSDSWDYIVAAEDIHHRMDFYSFGLRDVRVPMYPVLLAVTYPITGMQSDRIVLVQKIIGMSSVLLGLAIGHLLHSRLLAEGLVLFLGLNPVYLFNEHALMTETLFLFTLLSFVIVILICLRGELNWPKGLILGLVLATCVLTRTNALPFCAILTLAVVLIRITQGRLSPSFTAQGRNLLIFTATMCVTALVFIAPWLWRNYVAYGNISLVNFTKRNLLIYKSMHNPLDTSLPLITEVNKSLSTQEMNYDWLWKLGKMHPTTQAEKIAGDLVWEQVVNHPVRYVQEVLQSFFGFGGFYDSVGNERSGVMYWFRYIVNDLTLLHKINTSLSLRLPTLDFIYVSREGNTMLARLWSQAGVLFLGTARPLLYVSFFFLGFVYLIYRWMHTSTTSDIWNLAIILFGSGYIFIASVHTVTLTDSDRYATSFDPISLITVLLIIDSFLKQRGLRIWEKFVRLPSWLRRK